MFLNLEVLGGALTLYLLRLMESSFNYLELILVKGFSKCSPNAHYGRAAANEWFINLAINSGE